MQPKVAHLNEPEAPLNVENPRGASETTASLANLTTGLAGSTHTFLVKLCGVTSLIF